MAARRPLLNNLRQRPPTKVSSQYHAFSPSGIENVECLPLPRIADIFDAPTRLDSTNGHQFFFLHRASTAPPTPTMATRSSNAGRSSGGLPAPLMFEGPAHPRSSFSLLSTKLPRTVKSQSRSHQTSHKTSSMLQDSTSIPLSIKNAAVHTYEGPSNMTRYRYKGQKKKNDDGRKPLLAMLSLATLAVGTTVFLDL
ncbi:hypothetical protein EV359DRAFT_81995 [Lentinula novae-zelandiae]|nr:hypothetical protein EV359DRAFT_81995 [Lentinula novae-zelandiae]